METVREGSIAANVFLGTSKEGRQQHIFKLSRSYKPKSASENDEFNYSDLFFANNSDALARVVVAAATRCQELDGKPNDKQQ